MSESMEVEEQVYEEETPSKIPNHRVYANHTSHGSKRKGKKTSYIMWAIQAIIRPVKKMLLHGPRPRQRNAKSSRNTMINMPPSGYTKKSATTAKTVAAKL